MIAACWSECVWLWSHVPSNGEYEKHLNPKFQYGPMVFQPEPPFCVS